MMCFRLLFSVVLTFPFTVSAQFSKIPTKPKPGDVQLAEYFEAETNRLAKRSLTSIKTAKDWNEKKAGYRRQLFEMLGLQPLPARSDLKPEITGSITRDGVVVENLAFQSRPGLYVTANFYRPEKMPKGVEKLPTILYVCGHGRVEIDGVSYGNKTNYQHHGTWFAKNGYTCLMVDTLQLGEIEGVHHGTFRMNRWWWNARGYTPAGVEAWNCIRALDYLETRPEVDAEKIGVTGRSGGGAYSWWISALDDRIAVSAPVAGITNMKNHVVDGCVEGHCDCMFAVNTYRWDFPLVAALVAPRPLLIANTDDDQIFPLDGVVDVFEKTQRIYDLLGAHANSGLAVVPGPHKDTQPLRVPVFHWFERHLKGKSLDSEIADTTAPKIFEPQELKVFKTIPENERNTVIDDYFTRRIPRKLKVPESKTDWKADSQLMQARLKSKSFRGWPGENSVGELDVKADFSETKDGITFTRYSFQSQMPWWLPLFVVHRAEATPADLDLVVLNVLDDENWDDFLTGVGAAFPKAFPEIDKLPKLDADRFSSEKKMYTGFGKNWAMAYTAPRGIGPTVWTNDTKERIHIRRRFNLLGQTLDGMQVWDTRRAIQALRELDGMTKPNLWLQSSGTMAGNTLYASLFEKDIHRLDLHRPPTTHRDGPTYLNVLRFMDLPQAAVMAAEKSQLRIYADDKSKWEFLTQSAAKLKLPEAQLQIRDVVSESE